MKLSLIIPCYNEMASFPALIARCRETFKDKEVEVILVDNGSTDKTPEILLQLIENDPILRTVRVEKNQGYGHGILQGLHAATGDILAWTHADMQTDPADVLRGMELFTKYGNNIFVKGQRTGRPLSDIVFTVGMSIFETVLFRKLFWDINAQPVMFPKTFFSSWKNPPSDFSLDLYAYYQAHHCGLTIKRFPVTFGKRMYGQSHWNVDWKSKIKFIKRTLSYSFSLLGILNK